MFIEAISRDVNNSEFESKIKTIVKQTIVKDKNNSESESLVKARLSQKDKSKAIVFIAVLRVNK